jgi:hypothetical protein
MMRLLIILSITILASFVLANALLHPAELRLENESQRKLTVKVMKKIPNDGSKRYTIDSVMAKSSKTIYIHETGDYYLKTKAELSGKETLYKRGNPFEVYVGDDGYTVMTVTFNINEDSLPDPLSGEMITQSDYEADED